MQEFKGTPGPWKWQGEDYRAGWGWMMLVGPNGEGLIVGQDENGGPSKHLMAFQPVDPSLCLTGMMKEGKPHVEPVHVYSEHNARLIKAAPELLHACQMVKDFLNKLENLSEEDPLLAMRRHFHGPLHEALDAGLNQVFGGGE